MSKGSITQISLKSNEELVKRTKQTQTRKFYMVGKEALVNKASKGEKADWQWEGIDFIDVMVSLSSREQRIIKLIKDCIKWDKKINSFNYIVCLEPDSVEFDPAVENYIPYSTFQKGFATLFKQDLVRRVSRHHYMFNPDFFIPTGELVAHFDIKWNKSRKYAQ